MLKARRLIAVSTRQERFGFYGLTRSLSESRAPARPDRIPSAIVGSYTPRARGNLFTGTSE